MRHIHRFAVCLLYLLYLLYYPEMVSAAFLNINTQSLQRMQWILRVYKQCDNTIRYQFLKLPRRLLTCNCANMARQLISGMSFRHTQRLLVFILSWSFDLRQLTMVIPQTLYSVRYRSTSFIRYIRLSSPLCFVLLCMHFCLPAAQRHTELNISFRSYAFYISYMYHIFSTCTDFFWLQLALL